MIRCETCDQISRFSFEPAGSERYADLLRTRANVLITGPQARIDRFLTLAHPELQAPVVKLSAIAQWPDNSIRTVILPNVDHLIAADQGALLRRVELHTHVQIVSLATRRLFPMVREGRFDARLYYRLNTIYFDLHDLAAATTNM